MYTQSLQRLGLDQGADERAVKRAYARELKLIDQVQDAAGFQVLREAYEAALYWLKHQADMADVAPAPLPPTHVVADPQPAAVEMPAAEVAAPPADAFAAEDPQQLARDMFDVFLRIYGEMVEHGKGRDAALWSSHLKRCVDDDRLLNISARAYFEFHLAGLLANGWRPGHEGLFVAAREFFGWEKDRRRLMEFGQYGSVLNQAIDECVIFEDQGTGACSGQTDAILRVRDSEEPATRDLITHVPHLRIMQARFPAWTYVIADTDRIAQWNTLEQAIPAWRRRITRVRPRSTETKWSGLQFWHVALVLFVLHMVVSAIRSDPAPSTDQYTSQFPATFGQASRPLTEQEAREEEAYKRAAGKFYIPPGSRALDPALMGQVEPTPAIKREPAAQLGRGFSDAELETIFARVDHKPVYPKPGSYLAEFEITLDERGAISKVVKKRASGMPGLDPKVEQAIRAAAPFSADRARRFTMSYGLRYSKQVAPAQSPAQSTQEQPAQEPTAEPEPPAAE